jgi:hypothetical protein
MLERDYQRELIPRIKALFPPRECEVLKNNSGYRQGIPDLSVFWRRSWAWLEVKPKKPTRPEDWEPNQEWYVNWANTTGWFGATIYPENEKEVLCALGKAFGLSRPARITSTTEQASMAQLR